MIVDAENLSIHFGIQGNARRDDVESDEVNEGVARDHREGGLPHSDYDLRHEDVHHTHKTNTGRIVRYALIKKAEDRVEDPGERNGGELVADGTRVHQTQQASAIRGRKMTFIMTTTGNPAPRVLTTREC